MGRLGCGEAGCGEAWLWGGLLWGGLLWGGLAVGRLAVCWLGCGGVRRSAFDRLTVPGGVLCEKMSSEVRQCSLAPGISG